jgi:hypothetical protein
MLADVRAHVSEAKISIEAAIVAGESVAGHGIVPSRDFENVMEQLRLAAEALDKVELPDGVVLRFPQAVRV